MDEARAAEALSTAAVLQRLGLAAALGLLVGMQRERAGSRLAGIRTFSVITVWGALSAVLALRLGGWIVVAGALALAILIVVENVVGRGARGRSRGITTESAALLMFTAGAVAVVGEPLYAVVVSGGLAFLLHQKRPLHRLVARIGEEDFRAVMQFALISLAILPVLPNRPFGPWETLNPFHSWLMVVLIVGIGLAGYVAFKALGSRAGVLLGGVLGGLVSSTATTVTMARRVRDAERGQVFAQLVITLASAVAFARILVEVGIIAPGILAEAGPPLAIVLATMLAVAGLLYVRTAGAKVDLPPVKNPAGLGPALAFAAVYTVVTLASSAARDFLGPGALYGVALVAGLTDVDAITLSTAEFASRGAIPTSVAWRVILVAALSNLAFKLGIVCVLGPRLAPRIGFSFGAATAVGALLIAFWPGP